MNLAYVPRSEFDRILQTAPDRVARQALFAQLCRINVLYMVMRAGSGHLGTSFSCLDLVSAILLNELDLTDPARVSAPAGLYFSSKGHDVPAFYSALTGLGLLNFDLLHQLRRLGGLPGHPDIGTPHIVTNTGSLGMGISKAKGLALANRLRGQPVPIYVLTGDGELQEGQFWESLPTAVHHRLGELTVIVDHNKLQSDTFVACVNDLGDLPAKLTSFGWQVARCDGHDPAAINATLAKLRTTADRPKIIIADTVKGRGVSFMEHTALPGPEALYRFHSGAPSTADYAAALEELLATTGAMLQASNLPPLQVERVSLPDRGAPSPTAQRLVRAYGQALVEQAARNQRLVVLDADLMLDCGLIPFRERFPDRFIECGIAEQDMVSTAGGLALAGMLPVVHSFACFLSTRPNEQIYNNATERTKIVYVGSLAGLVPGGPGHSHQSVRDISALAAIPGLVLLEPATEAEVGLALDYCLNDATTSCYLRLVSIPVDVPFTVPPDYRLVLGQGVPLTEGRDAVLFTYGPVMLSQAVQAAHVLARRGLTLAVYNLPWLNRIDRDWLARVTGGIDWVFTLDNHYTTGGQGDLVLSTLATLPRSGRGGARKLGLVDIPACGTNDEVLAAHRLDAASLADEIVALVRAGAPVA